jgi:molybdenum-dependent DNA-binding transcriptional regulator ModE
MAQYRGGRQEGRKNLVKEGDKLINEYGVQFSIEEKKDLERMVNKANARRQKLIKERNALPYSIAGRPTGFTVGEIPSFIGMETDMISKKPKSKSMQRFRSRKEFEMYMQHLEKITSKDYLKQRIGEYKKNHTAALKDVFGERAQELVDKINTMNDKDYLKMVQSDEALDIKYIESDQDEGEFAVTYGYQRNEQLNKIEIAYEQYNAKTKATKTPDEIYSAIMEGKMEYKRGRRKNK